jgi:hypothetical protein
MNVMKIFFSHAALLCSAVLSMPGAMAAGMPVHVLAPNASCWMPEQPTPEQTAEQKAAQPPHRRTALVLGECGLVDANKDVDEHPNTGESEQDPWKKVDGVIELSRQYTEDGEHQLSSAGTRSLRLGDDGSDVAGLPDSRHAQVNGVMPSVPEPSSHAMMTAGLLLLGGRMWHRRRRTAAAK